jgi:predicted transcriptional regulator YdeE
MIELKECKLIGLSLESKTSNRNGKSSIDCGNLWQKFEAGGYYQNIPGKLSADIFAVYYDYEGDYTKPFSYFIGCKVDDDTKAPEGMKELVIPNGKYWIVKTRGMIPDCISKAWGVIWSTVIKRAYVTDFEVYGEKSRDWKNAEIDIFLSVV